MRFREEKEETMFVTKREFAAYQREVRAAFSETNKSIGRLREELWFERTAKRVEALGLRLVNSVDLSSGTYYSLWRGETEVLTVDQREEVEKFLKGYEARKCTQGPSRVDENGNEVWGGA